MSNNGCASAASKCMPKRGEDSQLSLEVGFLARPRTYALGHLRNVPKGSSAAYDRRCGFTSNARKCAPTSAVLVFRLASRVDTGAKGLATDFPTVAEI